MRVRAADILVVIFGSWGTVLAENIRFHLTWWTYPQISLYVEDCSQRRYPLERREHQVHPRSLPHLDESIPRVWDPSPFLCHLWPAKKATRGEVICILKVVGSNIQQYRREREISTPLDGECLSIGVLAGDESLWKDPTWQAFHPECRTFEGMRRTYSDGQGSRLSHAGTLY